jgi:hypothetical protein
VVIESLPARSGHRFSEKRLRFVLKDLFGASTLKKRAAHGDMSRSWGEALRYSKKHSYRGRCILHYHYVACQAFFSFFEKNEKQPSNDLTI